MVEFKSTPSFSFGWLYTTISGISCSSVTVLVSSYCKDSLNCSMVRCRKSVTYMSVAEWEWAANIELFESMVVWDVCIWIVYVHSVALHRFAFLLCLLFCTHITPVPLLSSPLLPSPLSSPLLLSPLLSSPSLPSPFLPLPSFPSYPSPHSPL